MGVGVFLEGVVAGLSASKDARLFFFFFAMSYENVWAFFDSV
jgi:hypothetical protein